MHLIFQKFTYSSVIVYEMLTFYLLLFIYISVKAIEITIKFLNLLYNYCILMELLFFLKKKKYHFPFKIEDFNLHHLKAKIMNITEPFAQE